MDESAAEWLRRSGAPSVFLDVYAGEMRPPLTDYYLQPVPAEWSASPPRELVGNNVLVPVFCDADGYTIYCIDRDTLRVLAIDVEEPWPPLETYDSWSDVMDGFLRVFSENHPEAVQRLERLFEEPGT
jgi:hypothetical protein